MINGNVRLRRFVEEFPRDFNATQAAIRAGYSQRTAKQQGSRLLTRVDVQRALSEFITSAKRVADQRASAAVMDEAEVQERLTRVARANLGDVIRISADGDAYIDLSKAGPNELEALAEVTVDDLVIGRGEDRREVRRVRVKLHNKLEALTLMAKRYGLLRERVEGTVGESFAEQLKRARLRVIADRLARESASLPHIAEPLALAQQQALPQPGRG